VIELTNITKVYQTNTGPHVVLHDVSFTVRLGTSLGILGKNGAGKSTLLRIIGGAELPTTGRVTRRSRVSWPIGFAGAFHGSLTGEENCRFAARIYGQDVLRVVEETREFADIGRYFYNPVRTYSTGMRARLAFGLSMSIAFDVYLVDEVTAVGDRTFRKKCGDALNARRTEGSLIVVSHSMKTIHDLCDRAAVLDRGVLTVYETVDEAEEVYTAGTSAG
jgi:capsular polysaccharide transport system ATP-binding protein